VDILKQRKEQGPRSIVYNEAEIQNIFTLFDLKGEGHITKSQCIEALKALANSEFHFSKAQEANIPDKVELYSFMKLW
jgi:Ca2+-binding EF-hand superfamily protein